mgnify:FL=1
MRQFVEMFLAMSAAVAFAEEGEFNTASSLWRHSRPDFGTVDKLQTRKTARPSLRNPSMRA